MLHKHEQNFSNFQRKILLNFFVLRYSFSLCSTFSLSPSFFTTFTFSSFSVNPVFVCFFIEHHFEVDIKQRGKYRTTIKIQLHLKIYLLKSSYKSLRTSFSQSWLNPSLISMLDVLIYSTRNVSEVVRFCDIHSFELLHLFTASIVHLAANNLSVVLTSFINLCSLTLKYDTQVWVNSSRLEHYPLLPSNRLYTSIFHRILNNYIFVVFTAGLHQAIAAITKTISNLF